MARSNIRFQFDGALSDNRFKESEVLYWWTGRVGLGGSCVAGEESRLGYDCDMFDLLEVRVETSYLLETQPVHHY
jgi:hypothetical protein